MLRLVVGEISWKMRHLRFAKKDSKSVIGITGTSEFFFQGPVSVLRAASSFRRLSARGGLPPLVSLQHPPPLVD